jgi:hypothetical protein
MSSMCETTDPAAFLFFRKIFKMVKKYEQKQF